MPDKHKPYRRAPGYEEKRSELSKEYMQDVQPLLESNDKNLRKRISTFVTRCEFDYCEVVEKIKADVMFAATFAKDPGRTGFHEKLAAEWLAEEKELIQDFEKLPASGPNAWYINNGKIRQGGKPTNGTKSFDFSWCTKGLKIWASHKYTRESGGSQDNQLEDVRALLREFKKMSEKNVVLIVIVDGAYYNDVRMKRLRARLKEGPPTSFAAHIEDVPEILESLPE